MLFPRVPGAWQVFVSRITRGMAKQEASLRAPWSSALSPLCLPIHGAMQPIRAQKHQQWLSYPLEMLSWMLVLQFRVCSSLGRDLSMDEESDPLGSAAFLVQHFGHRVSLSFQARLQVGSGEAPRGESRLPHADGRCFPSCLQPGVVQGSLRLRLESSWNYRGHSAGWAVFPQRWDPAAAPVLGCFERCREHSRAPGHGSFLLLQPPRQNVST